MTNHPPVRIVGGDVFTHDVELLDDETSDPWPAAGHTFSATMRTGEGGPIMSAIVMTCEVIGANMVRITMTAEVTTLLAAAAKRAMYYLRDDTLEFTILKVEALVDVLS